MQHSPLRTIVFSALLCIAFSALVSTVAVGLRERQQENIRLDRIKNVLGVAGLRAPGETLSAEQMAQRFESGLQARLVDLAAGQFAPAEAGDPLNYDARKQARDPQSSSEAPPNLAKVRRLPQYAVVYLTQEGGVILPIEGQGLWSTLYGYLALDADLRTVRGITYYDHGETPGLGGEVDNPRWKELWPGRLAFDERGQPALQVNKGAAGPPAEDPYRVDGLSGATITSRGVSHMLEFWLGRSGFGPFLETLRAQRGNVQ